MPELFLVNSQDVAEACPQMKRNANRPRIHTRIFGASGYAKGLASFALKSQDEQSRRPGEYARTQDPKMAIIDYDVSIARDHCT